MTDDSWQADESLLLNALMDNVADSIYFKDRRCRLQWASLKMAKDLGYDDPSEIVGKTDKELFGEEFGKKTMVDDLGVMETGQPIIGLVESRTLPNGEINWTSTTKFPIHDKSGAVIGLLGITREINELKRTEQDLHYLATHDILTSLPNRYLLFDRMENTILRARRNDTLFAVLYVDLDGFKMINDRFGHDTGDRVLKQAAALLAAACEVPVAKHGNRAVSSQSGSADVLAALDFDIDPGPDVVGSALRVSRFAFMFAPRFHPAMKHALGPRREIGVRTVFNILGPLCNPAAVKRQVIGVFRDKFGR